MTRVKILTNDLLEFKNDWSYVSLHLKSFEIMLLGLVGLVRCFKKFCIKIAFIYVFYNGN